ncbi:histidinol-phosphate aminotransferase [Nocardioides scoriae]|uniref:Aromatic amino acid aminotransferase n=1 Tax=Nocardioides scoriae TaxID=642780 RepID=A0A1H1WBA1_9ACTN|nr:histidinol-phosphate transaminase [Nocardioides scoriae]SDS94608.1 histidinol-phosphate aminotransferase [Nocardioides scoriae]
MSTDTPSSAPRPRATIAAIPAYVAGKPPVPRPGQQVFKLSSNENPYPPLPGVVEAAEAAVQRMNRYPDMGNGELYAALAERLGVRPEQLAAGTGSVAVLYHLLQAFCEPGDEVVYAWRSFEAYPIAVSANGATSVRVPVGPDGRHDLDAMASAITDRTRVVVVCTPNNPTGTAVSDAELRAFVDRVPAHVLVVVDEAYREFVRAEDPVDALALAAAHPNVAVMRTFAKAYGLAGFRVGYLVADPVVAGAVRACALPFGVSTVAQAAAVASLDAEAALLERVDALVEERDRVVATLTDLGWQVPEAQGNFVWLPLGDRALDFAAEADRAGISVRPFAGDGVRVSIGEPEGNDVFLEVAASWVRGGGDGEGTA